ncbi:unnamed protein product [Meloidogyne enterolobii]|uniref:Uncharacterized protein n=1 Tax=Meloidogyne enterolobii TaxID=390850 RepID=A0ACB0XLF8_MELEN
MSSLSSNKKVSFGISLIFVLLAICSAFPGRHSSDFQTRFFIPDSSLAANLLAGPPQFVPGPSMHQPVLALRPPFKRYFDSLAGQSLGKRSVPQFEYNIEEKRK